MASVLWREKLLWIRSMMLSNVMKISSPAIDRPNQKSFSSMKFLFIKKRGCLGIHSDTHKAALNKHLIKFTFYRSVEKKSRSGDGKKEMNHSRGSHP